MAQLCVVVLVDKTLRTGESDVVQIYLLAPLVLLDSLAIGTFASANWVGLICIVDDRLLCRGRTQLTALFINFFRADELQIRRGWFVVVVAFSGLNGLHKLARTVLAEELCAAECKGCNAHQLPAADSTLRYNCWHFNFKLFEIL